MTDQAKRIENSAKAVILDGSRVLLMRYTDDKMGLGVWHSLPGGRQQFGETLSETLVRECLEEIGAEVKPERLLFIREYIHSRHHLAGKGRDQHKVEFYFVCSLVTHPRADYTADDAVADEGQEGFFWCELPAVAGLKVFPTGLRDLADLVHGSGNEAAYWGDTF